MKLKAELFHYIAIAVSSPAVYTRYCALSGWIKGFSCTVFSIQNCIVHTVLSWQYSIVSLIYIPVGKATKVHMELNCVLAEILELPGVSISRNIAIPVPVY